MSDRLVDKAFETLTDYDGDNGDLNGKAAEHEPANGLRHSVSLSMTKVADGLIDPKLVLSWLLNALGAPAFMVGALVPIREAGALLPQIFLAGWVQRMSHRKWAWVVGSLGQGASAALIVLSALTLNGALAGAAICAALFALALFRASCSVSFKDILGKTVAKSRRGAITGIAGSVSALGVLLFAGLLVTGVFQNKGIVLGAIALAAALWIGAALLFSQLKEEPSDIEGDAAAVSFDLLRDNPQLWRFITVRGLLVSTALAPPYLVLLAADAGLAALQTLGTLVLASAAASFVSSYIWGRLADRSSRKVLMRSGVLGAAAMLAAVGMSVTGLAQSLWAMPGALFVLMIAYHGVRQGRSTYLVDMADEGQRSAYAAVANTVIGVLLLIAGAAGGILSFLGASATLCGFAAMAIGAAIVALGLHEVEQG
ncbi:MFS transporter [Arenibacterium sp. CAU 1754]